MTDLALKIKDLGKKYVISHEESQGSYKTLRDSLTGLFKRKKKVSKEEFWAVKEIDLEIKKGDKVAIIGRNGAGKSTLLKLLSRITEPSMGKAEINGRVASLLEVGTGFHPELSGRENIYLNGAILGMSKKEIEAKFDDIVEFSGCEKFLDTPVKRYSSGMRVRLGFAVAAHLESEILIVDEVLAVGDAEFQKKCLGKMDEISKGEGRTIIFVSHNMSAVQNLCDKGVVLDKGEVKFIGDIDEAIRYYDNRDEDEIIHIEKLESKSLFSKVWIENNKGIKTREIKMGEEFSINIEFKEEIKSPDPVLWFTIYGSGNNKITTFVSMYSSKTQLNENFNKACFKVKDNNLLPNQYRLELAIGYGKIRISPIESFDEYGTFTIDKSDYFNTGFYYNEKHGSSFMKDVICETS